MNVALNMGERLRSMLRKPPTVDFQEWIFEKPKEYQAQGVDILPLLGAPRDDPPEHILEASRGAARNSHIDNRGVQEFREAIAAKLARENGVEVDPDTQVLVTNGALNALFISLLGVLDNGDEVILPTPQFYHWHAIELAGGVPVPVPTSEVDGWRWDLDAITKAITPRTKAIVITSPVNPTGYVPAREDLQALAEIALGHNLFVLEDQSYEKFVYDGTEFVPMASLPEMKDHALSLYSFHKGYRMHAWRLGFIAGPIQVVSRLTFVSTWTNLRVNYTSQMAGNAALRGPQDWISDMVKQFEQGRNAVLEGLADDPGITMAIPVMGGTMGYLNVGGVGMSSRKVAEYLLANYGVPTVPGDAFGPARDSSEQVRIAFHMEDDKYGFDEVVSRIKMASADMRGTT